WVGGLVPELAVRRSVGARRRDVLLYVSARSAVMIAAGLMLGLMLAFLSSAPLESIVPGAQTLDTSTILQVALALTVTTGLAISIPVWRACRLTPVELLAQHDL